MRYTFAPSKASSVQCEVSMKSGRRLSFLLLAALAVTSESFIRTLPARREVRELSRRHLSSPQQKNIFNVSGLDICVEHLDDSYSMWHVNMGKALNPYKSPLYQSERNWDEFVQSLQEKANSGQFVDPFWEQVKVEAVEALEMEPAAGPQLYQGILSQPSLLRAICTVISHQIETELIPATELKNLFLGLLTPEDEYAIRLDLQAVAARSPAIENAMLAILFHNGYHALVCYRVGHRLWQAGRTGLAYYLQSTVSRKYSADIHPACRMGHGIYLRVGAGVVIGETAVVGNDVSILEGVTLGGTGKEAGDRHPKVGNGVIIFDGGTVLGNIQVGDGAVVSAKSIVTKPVPPLAIVSGVPAKIQSYRDLNEAYFDDELQRHLATEYLPQWREQMENIESDS